MVFSAMVNAGKLFIFNTSYLRFELPSRIDCIITIYDFNFYYNIICYIAYIPCITRIYVIAIILTQKN